MENTLIVRIKSVYGIDKVYPVNEQAKKVATLLGQKTITQEKINQLKDIGFIFEVDHEPSASL